MYSIFTIIYWIMCYILRNNVALAGVVFVTCNVFVHD